MPVKKDSSEEEQVKLTAIHDLDGVAPKAIPEDELIGDSRDTMALNPDQHQQPGIQFIPAQTNNADAKVELGSVPVPAFVGLGKEELMKYANDPFWVRLRWFLFILFWVVWLGMLVGAIVIIVLAPKCPDMTKGQEVVKENGPFYQVYLDKFSPNGKIERLVERADYIKSLGFNSIIISQIFETSASAGTGGNGISTEVTNFTNISPAYGTLDQFRNVTQVFKDRGIKVILQIVPNHSSREHLWFKEKGNDFYILKSYEEIKDSTWKSVYGADIKAWSQTKLGDDAAPYYLHQFKAEEADLNYRSDNVINAMNEVTKFWYEAGVDGFLFSDVSYLVENLGKLNDANATKNHPENQNVVQKLIDTTKWTLPEKRNPPFALLDLTDVNTKESLKYTKDYSIPILADLQSQYILPKAYNSSDLYQHFGTDIGSKFVLRRFSSPRMPHLMDYYNTDKGRGNILALISFLSKGEVIVYYGDEQSPITPFKGATENALDKNLPSFTGANPSSDNFGEYFKTLISVHNTVKNQSKSGDDTVTYYDNNGTFGFRRVTPDRNIIVIVNVNGGHHEVVNLHEALQVNAKRGKVLVATPGATTITGNTVDDLKAVHVQIGTGLAILEIADDQDPLKSD